MTEHIAYIGLGSNIEPAHNLQQAVATLRNAALPGHTRLLAVSSAWSSPARGTQGPQFLNAAAKLTTQLDPEALKLQVLRPLEAAQGRVRTADRNAPRTLDMDLLVYDGQEIDAEIWQAAHIALPLSELLPELAAPDSRETLLAAAARLAASQPNQRSELVLKK
ncbi:MAG TPA: 2-amino-4-hydroxy-6-hydroxymethyldihydropteridine diphosphokinase [Anaerolineales bacterium]|nr:2-amino-4-hydroxy-6-hydroxymethyldihydropteridine diphosphokinase [Anaerolineales bacterium]HRQ91423.1 2-amino-4-hydroxy-6-hydroxymethyldihydropteridine diphosphokinase [Anaerolineales bacterium]